MCRECQDAVPQSLYCVHSDRIAHLDTEIARGHGRESGRFRPIATSGRSQIDKRRDEVSAPPIISDSTIFDCVGGGQIADELWRRFMLRHPHHRGPLQEYHLSGFGRK